MEKVSNTPIDAVITWVDGSDINFQKEKAKYQNMKLNPESINEARFRNWDNFELLVKGIKKNLPWLRYIYIVTNGQIPKWYKEDKKIKLVFHKDFIPSKYLPTFSSHTIELNLHRIKGLSEKFIYFNDDTFVIKPMKEENFFKNNKPCDAAILHVHCEKKSLMIHNIANNDISVINEYFQIKEVLNKHKAKWFNLKYGIKYNIQNIIFSKCPRFPGIKQFHMPNAYLKQTFKEVWEKEYEYLDYTCSCKFRQKDGLNQWIMREWQLCSGNFTPIKIKNRGILIDFEKNNELEELDKCLKMIKKSPYQMICINDGDKIKNYNKIKKEINRELKKLI